MAAHPRLLGQRDGEGERGREGALVSLWRWKKKERETEFRGLRSAEDEGESKPVRLMCRILLQGGLTNKCVEPQAEMGTNVEAAPSTVDTDLSGISESHLSSRRNRLPSLCREPGLQRWPQLVRCAA